LLYINSTIIEKIQRKFRKNGNIMKDMKEIWIPELLYCKYINIILIKQKINELISYLFIIMF
jgi:hypothetical protein